MDYICSALHRCGKGIEIISASRTKNRNNYAGKYIAIQKGIMLRLFPTIGRGNKIKNAFSLYQMNWRLFHYLLFQTKAGEPILVYHSVGYALDIWLARKIRKFQLILEVEEIYQDVVPMSMLKKWEEKKVIQSADKYIFSTESLNCKLNQSNKPYVVVNGTYEVEKNYQEAFADGKVHCVYAGTFDSRKGSSAAVAAAEYLPENYHIHILGFGTQEQKEHLQEQIAKVQKRSKSTLSYDGLITGKEYIRFLQKCQIGLCTQTPDSKYVNTSFPSKILSYLSNGLRVLCAKIPVVENSSIGDLLFYYEKQEPQAIAQAILKIPLSSTYNSRARIQILDQDFMKKIANLF